MASATFRPSKDHAAAAAAAVYARWVDSFTGAFVPAVMAAAAPVGPGTCLLDVAAGTGAAAVAAAAAGATVLATDLAPGMVAAASAALAPYPRAEAKVMDGQALVGVPDGAHDVVLSVFGVITFPDWRAGLAELVRTTAPGGRLVLTSWTTANGAAFFPILMDTYREAFPDKPVPAIGAGVGALSTPGRITAALAAAGAERITVEEVTQTWTGPAVGNIRELSGLLERAPFYAALDEAERARLYVRLATALGRHAGADGVIRIPGQALVTLAHKPMA